MDACLCLSRMNDWMTLFFGVEGHAEFHVVLFPRIMSFLLVYVVGIVCKSEIEKVLFGIATRECVISRSFDILPIQVSFLCWCLGLGGWFTGSSNLVCLGLDLHLEHMQYSR